MRKTRVIFLITVLTELLLTSVVAPDVAGQSSGQTVTWEWLGPPESLDPHVDYEPSGAWISWNVYETLFSYDLESDNAEVTEPLLATSYIVSGDGLNYTFQLREDVSFHDGTPFNSTCVKYSFERLMAVFDLYGPAWLFAYRILGGQAVMDAVYNYGSGTPEHVSNYGAWVEQEPIVTLDEYTVRFRLSEPYAPFIDVIAHPIGSQISPTYIEEHGGVVIGERNDWLGSHTCGTGPYMVTNMTDDIVQMDLNVNYWRAGQARIDHPRAGSVSRICIRANPLDDNRTANLESGVTDGCDWPVSQADRVYNGVTGDSGNGTLKSLNPDLKVWTGEPEFSMSFLAFNLNATMNYQEEIRTNPFRIRELREAVSYAFDYDEYIQNMTGGLGLQLQGPIPRGMSGHRDDLFVYHRNITAAVEKWNQAMMEGLDIALASWNYSLPIHYRASSTIYTTIPPTLVKEGIESILNDSGSMKPSSALTINLVPQAGWYRSEGQLVYSLGWESDIADPDDFAAHLIRSTSSYPVRIALADSEGWNATEIDELIAQAARKQSEAERNEIYGIIQEGIVEHCAYIYCVQYTNFHVEHVKMNGYQFSPVNGPYFYHYWKTEDQTSPATEFVVAAVVAASVVVLFAVPVLLRRTRKMPDIDANQ